MPLEKVEIPMHRPKVRDVALRILCRIENTNAYADKLLEDALSTDRVAGKEKDLLREFVLGTLRWRKRLDWIICSFSKRNFEDLRCEIRNILRLGTYQILFVNGIPDYAAVSESVELTKKWGLSGSTGFVNAILRNITRQKDRITFPDKNLDPVSFLSVFYSHPEWLVERWLQRYGFEDTAVLCRANNLPRPTSIRTNRLLVSSERLYKDLGNLGFEIEPNPFLEGFFNVRNPGGLFESEIFKAGWFQVQDVSAGLAVRLLDPQPGERVLDLCSAPGGKTTYIAELMQNRGLVVAIDKYPNRMTKLCQNVARLKIDIVKMQACNALEYESEPFDRVLVDVPCSGSGVLARRADLRWNLSPQKIEEMTKLQLALLRSGARLAKPGATVVYSTCSIEPEENEEIVRKFLSSNSDFQLLGTTDFPFASPEDGFVQTFPHKQNCDGSFAARLTNISLN